MQNSVSEKYTIERYNEVEKKIVGDLMKVDGVVSVYTFGDIKAPGNSDIDWLIGVDLSTKTCDDIIEIFEFLDDDEKFIAYVHYPIIIDFDLMKFFNYIRYSDSLIYKAGKKVKFIVPNKEILLYQIIDLLIQYYPHNLLNMSKYNLRFKFQIINAFRHICSSVKMVLGNNVLIPEQVISIININDKLRKNFNFFENNLELENFFKDNINILLQYITELKIMLSNYLISNHFIKKSMIKNKFFYNTLFTDKQDLYSKMFDIKGDYYNNLFCEPISFYCLFNPVNGDVNDKLKQGIYERNKVIYKYVEFNNIFNRNRTIYFPWWIKSICRDNSFKSISTDNQVIQNIMKEID